MSMINNTSIKKLLLTGLHYLLAFSIIAGCLWCGRLISALLPVMIPDSIIGLLLLFFLLSFQIIPSNWVKPGCNLFIRYMTILFIPPAMGIMEHYPTLIDGFLPIIVGCIGSSIIVLLVVGCLTDYLETRASRKAKTS